MVTMSASVGVSHMSHQPDDIRDMLDQADHAMYKAKMSRFDQAPFAIKG